jgi:molecular chaperone Hsp33
MTDSLSKNQTQQNEQQGDKLHRYVFNELDCRGELVQINQSLNQIFENHQYPQPVKQLLAELMVATALLTATLKFEGDISVQLQGDGPVKYAVINGNNKLELRGLAKLQGEIVNDDLHSLIGKGHMVITITPVKGERYQGIVLLEGEDLAQCIEAYFKQSEQLKTKLWIACELSPENNKAAALFLQILPANTTRSEEDFQHLSVLTGTVKDQELLHLDADTLLTRLYHQENPTVYPPQDVTFKCGCSREKTEAALASMDKQELLEQVESQGPINVDCQFCQASFSFNISDIKKFPN